MKLKQAIDLTSVHNARELGGYITPDGREIRRGLLLRTGNLNEISAEDICKLKDVYRLRHIIDFRMELEMPSPGDAAVEGAEYHHLDVIDSSAFDDADDDIESLDLIQTTNLTIQAGMFGEDMYIGFLESDLGKKAYAEFFRILLSVEPDRAVLWHCTGGKDRTGLAAMLLLSAFGADEELIMEDYLLTNEFNSQRVEATRQYLAAKGCEPGFIDKAVLVFDAVDESFMRSAMEHLKKEYGSVAGYIRDVLNINQDEINSLKEKYLV